MANDIKVLSANRMEQSPDKVGSSVTVLTKETLEKISFFQYLTMLFDNETALFIKDSFGYDSEILQFIAKILKQFKASLRIVHVNKSKAELNEDQETNKKILEDYFAKNEHSFHFLTNKKIEEGIQCFIDSRDINMIFMVAKNLNYFQQILFHSNVEDLSYHLEIPFFVLHENK